MNELISSNKPISGKELSTQLEVSSRTIREDIKEINQDIEAHGGKIKALRGKGYILEELDEPLFKKFIKQMKKPTNTIPDNPDSRMNYLIKKFLLAEDYITITEIADSIYVSEYTVQNDLELVRETLTNYSLSLESKPNYGLKIIGNEMNKRFAISDFIINKNQKNYRSVQFNSLENITGVDKSDIEIIWKVLTEIIKNEEISLADNAMNNYFIHLVIAYSRINHNHFIKTLPYETKEAIQHREYTVSKDIAIELEEKFDIQFPDNEIYYLAIHLLGAKRMNNSENKLNYKEVIDNETYKTIERIVNRVNEKLNLNIEIDDELIFALGLHLQTTISRYKFGMNIRNPMLNDIKNNYPIAFEAGIVASMVLEEDMGIVIDESEVAYIGIHFATAMERERLKENKLKIYVVCATGTGSSQLLQYKLRSEFSSQLEIIGVTNFYELDSIPFAEIDIIISTIPLPDDLPVEVLNVNLILGQKDISKIKNYIELNSNTIRNYINKSSVFLNQNLKTKNDVIEFLVDKAHDLSNISEDYCQLVLEREEIATTAYGNLVAIPHPIAPQGEKTFLVFCTLQEPILWGDKKVRLVCLFNVEKNNNKNLKMIYEYLIELVNKPKLVRNLVESNNYNEFVGYL